MTEGQDVSTSIVSRASQGVSEAALAGQLDEARWTAWKLRAVGGMRAALFLSREVPFNYLPVDRHRG